MSNDPNNPRPAASLTDQERADLRASDPAAFDDDVPEGDDTGAVAEAAGEGEGAGGDPPAGGAPDPAAAGAGDAAAAAAADGGKPPPPTVPKARFDEVIAQRNHAEDLARAQAAELATLRERMNAAAAPKDFDAEYERVLAEYYAGTIDDEAKDRQILALQREENAHTARLAALQTQTDTVQGIINTTWEQAMTAWVGQHSEFFQADPANAAIFQRAIDATISFHGPNISNDKLLSEAADMVFRSTGHPSLAPPAAGTTDTPGPTDPGEMRRRTNAAAAAAGSSAPAPLNGGVGGRGTAPAGVDVGTMKPGTFSKQLDKTQQERLLGEGAV